MLTVNEKKAQIFSLHKILIIGLGQLGLPVAKFIKEQEEFDVYGYVIISKAMDRAKTTA